MPVPCSEVIKDKLPNSVIYQVQEYFCFGVLKAQ